MPIAAVNGIKLSYEEHGAGEPVVLVSGTGAGGRVWTSYQVPALTSAGFQVITIDNRGVPPTQTSGEAFTTADMAADIAGLLEALGLGPCRAVGHSLGGVVVGDLMLTRPELVTQAVLVASRGRSDALRAALSAAEADLLDSGITLPPRYAAAMHAMHYLSPQTLNDDQRVRDWLDLFEVSPVNAAVRHAQRGLDDTGDRLESYRKVTCPCLVIGFADDLIVPPHLCRELAGRIPGSHYVQVAGCGHYGYLERPDPVNSLVIDFFRGAASPAAAH
jgi:pimeloyl-ACP methyl ester carboxylesterase